MELFLSFMNKKICYYAKNKNLHCKPWQKFHFHVENKIHSEIICKRIFYLHSKHLQETLKVCLLINSKLLFAVWQHFLIQIIFKILIFFMIMSDHFEYRFVTSYKSFEVFYMFSLIFELLFITNWNNFALQLQYIWHIFMTLHLLLLFAFWVLSCL